MRTGSTVVFKVDLHRGRRGRRRLDVAKPASPPLAPGRVPRVAKLMALAIRIDEMVRGGEVEDYAQVAGMAHLTRARLTQLMNLTLLAPEIQEAILLLPRVYHDRDPITERHLRPIAAVIGWRKQRRMWSILESDRKSGFVCSKQLTSTSDRSIFISRDIAQASSRRHNP